MKSENPYFSFLLFIVIFLFVSSPASAACGPLCQSIQNLINKSNWGQRNNATPSTPPRSFLLMPGYSSAKEIKELQKKIGVEQTGRYDYHTREKVREIQTNHNLRLWDDRLKIKEDGIVGPETGAILNEKYKLGADDNNYNTGSREGVMRIQQKLADSGFYDGEINGRYDNKTARAIGEFQKDYNDNLPDDSYKRIRVDKKWGTETKAAFEEIYPPDKDTSEPRPIAPTPPPTPPPTPAPSAPKFTSPPAAAQPPALMTTTEGRIKFIGNIDYACLTNRKDNQDMITILQTQTKEDSNPSESCQTSILIAKIQINGGKEEYLRIPDEFSRENKIFISGLPQNSIWLRGEGGVALFQKGDIIEETNNRTYCPSIFFENFTQHKPVYEVKCNGISVKTTKLLTLRKSKKMELVPPKRGTERF